jgi:asparagine synthase (glutamine-hydrolysing)
MLMLERAHSARALLRPLGALARGRKLRRYLDWAVLPLESRYRGVSSVFGLRDARRLLSRAIPSANGSDIATDYYDRTARLDPLRRMLYFDLKVWLPDDLLVKADKTTMAASVELRVPFLDHTLVEWAWRLPSDLKLRGGSGKHLLRQATRDLVPPEILTRSKKGFAIPLTKWFSEELTTSVQSLLATPSISALLDREEVDALLARQASGHEDLSHELFTLAVFALWYRQFIEPATLPEVAHA